MASERQRRSTAGKRMQTLTGKALEDDEAFWGHDTWKQDDDDDSGNESFHSSDEDSEIKKDIFDSDFDESESDHEEEEVAAGEEEERDLQRQERNKKRSNLKRSYLDISRAVPGKKGRGGATRGTKRVMGHGLNAGIVLNLPPNADLTLPAKLPVQAAAKASATPAASAASASADLVTSASVSPSRRNKASDSKLTLATTRSRRVTQLSKYSSRYRSARKDATNDSDKPATTTTVSQKKKKRQRSFTQEELLLEAANQTEPENARWLLGRKRIQNQSSQKDQEGREGRGSGGKVIEKYVSRRGYLNTVTFPEMDHVPRILTTQGGSSSRSRITSPTAPTLCVITGHRAKYRDPKTGMGYYDATAFRELRRRHAAGEPLDQRSLKEPPKQPEERSEKEENPSSLSAVAASASNSDLVAAKKQQKPSSITTETSVASDNGIVTATPSSSNGEAARTNGAEAMKITNMSVGVPSGSNATAVQK